MPFLSAILSATKKDPLAAKEARNVTAPGFKDLNQDFGTDMASHPPPSFNNAASPVVFGQFGQNQNPNPNPMMKLLGR